ncbi:MAG: UbiA family prenyltransferase [Bacteroidales bacterium]|nr:UbiA family prenyltransferase [Bacteroidales bacterium]
MARVKDFLSLVKFAHTIFALPFAVIGFLMASQQVEHYDWKIFIFILLDMIFARSAAMGFNRYLDRDIDKANPRTVVREIPAGKISPKMGLIFVIVNAVLFLVTTYFINRMVFFLAPVALAVILGYSYFKRFSASAHFILGLGLSLAPIGAFLCVKPEFQLVPVLLSFAVLFWVTGFDIIYALQDIDFDKQMNLKSIPAVLGQKRSLWLSLILHLMTFGLLLAIGFLQDVTSVFYWIGTGIFSLLLFYQHLIVKPDNLSRVNLAFFTTNGIASVLFMVFYLLEVFFPVYL